MTASAFALLASLVCTGFAPGDARAAATHEALQAAAPLLRERSFARVERGVELLAASGHARARDILEALLESSLYYRKADGTIVTVAATEGGELALTEAFSGQALGVEPKRALKRVRLNNALRGKLRAAIAGLDLRNADPDLRREAVEQIFAAPDDEAVAPLRDMRETETDEGVREAILTALALADLADAQASVRTAAAGTLSGNLHPAARNALSTLLQDETDANARAAAAAALERIERKLTLYRVLETLFFGLSLGAVLTLAAVGLAITFGVMGVINMAHGELMMLGAYTTYVLQQLMPQHIGASILIAIPAAFLVAAAAGIAIERSVIRFLYGRPLETLLATFGISLVLQQAVRSVFSPLNRAVETPQWMAGSLQVNPAFALTLNRLYIIVFCLLVFALLWTILRNSRLGLQVRAVTQNRAMARAMGVRSARVDALTFGLGSGVAGVAGVALSQLTNVGPNLGQAYIVDSFMVVVFGGVGNLWGTLFSGLTLGVANKLLEPFSGAVLAKILVLVVIILFIQKRPRGMFPQKGRTAQGS